MLRKIKGKSEFPADVMHTATGDVLSHLNTSTVCHYNEKPIKINLLPNSSHLEVPCRLITSVVSTLGSRNKIYNFLLFQAVNPIAVGKCRARQQTVGEQEPGDKVCNIQIHGDAAFSGQGFILIHLK